MSVEAVCWALALVTLGGCAVALIAAWPRDVGVERAIALGDHEITLEGAEIVVRQAPEAGR